MNLPLDAGHGRIDGSIFVAGGFAHAVEHLAAFDGYLGPHTAALDTENDIGLRLVAEIFVQLADLALCIAAKLVRDGDLLADDRELHTISSFVV